MPACNTAAARGGMRSYVQFVIGLTNIKPMQIHIYIGLLHPGFSFLLFTITTPSAPAPFCCSSFCLIPVYPEFVFGVPQTESTFAVSPTTMSSLAESYILASKVRSKLTREAANPRTSLRSLVLQANMLDNLMDHITVAAEKKQAQAKVSFSLPQPKRSPLYYGSSVTEYEVESDSDSEDDDDDDYYFSSDDEDDMDIAVSQPFHRSASQGNLLVIEEESEMPELSRSSSNSDSELEEEVADVNYTLVHSAAHKLSSEDLLRTNGHKDDHSRSHPAPSHHRSNSIYLMELMF